jgi:hypothetical protein
MIKPRRLFADHARRGNPRLVIDKIVINRWRGHNEHRVRETELRNAFGDLVARTMIPELAARQDAHSAQTAIHQFRGGRAMTLQLSRPETMLCNKVLSEPEGALYVRW